MLIQNFASASSSCVIAKAKEKDSFSPTSNLPVLLLLTATASDRTIAALNWYSYYCKVKKRSHYGGLGWHSSAHGTTWALQQVLGKEKHPLLLARLYQFVFKIGGKLRAGVNCRPDGDLFTLFLGGCGNHQLSWAELLSPSPFSSEKCCSSQTFSINRTRKSWYLAHFDTPGYCKTCFVEKNEWRVPFIPFPNGQGECSCQIGPKKTSDRDEGVNSVTKENLNQDAVNDRIESN